MIYYINNYYDEKNKTKRKPITSLASNNKIEYFHYVLKNKKQNFINVSFGFSKKRGFFRQEEINSNLIYLPHISVSEKNKYNLFSILYLQLVLILFILKNIKKDDTIILYHHPWIFPTFIITKFIKRYRLVLEVEELCFTDVTNNKLKNSIYRIFEKKIIALSDAYIVVNDIIKSSLENNYKKKTLVCYGNYSLSLENHISTDVTPEVSSNRLKILYSGSIDAVRGVKDVLKLFDLLERKDADIYITGYGTDEEIDKLKNELSKKNQDENTIKFLGALDEKAYFNLLEEVDICLNCQNDNQTFSKYSFPSKIINYLSFNNCVISTKMESVCNSKISNDLIFYDSTSILTLATIVNKFNKNNNVNINSKSLVQQLHKEFTKEFDSIL